MTDTPSPADVLEAVAKVVNDAEAECRKERYLFGFPTVHGKETLDKHIARAILDDRAAQAERIRELEEALRRADCPRPCNGRPDDFEVGQCVDAGECGCCLGQPLRARSALGGNNG